MVIRIVMLLLIELFCFQILLGQETGVVVVVQAPSKIKEIRGDPLRVDALSALISASGGDMCDWKWRRQGRHKLERKLGPFEFVEVMEFSSTNHIVMGYSHFTHGGQAARVVSHACLTGMTFDNGKAILLSVSRNLKAKMRSLDFMYNEIADGRFVIETQKPAYGGWSIRMSVHLNADRVIVFYLELYRKFESKKDVVKPIEIEVDI